MNSTTTIASIILAGLLLLVALHIVAELLRGIAAKAVAYVNIVLHVLMLLPLAYCKTTIEEAVLVYLISLFAYTVTAAIAYRRAEKARAKQTEEITDGESEINSEKKIEVEDALSDGAEALTPSENKEEEEKTV